MPEPPRSTLLASVTLDEPWPAPRLVVLLDVVRRKVLGSGGDDVFVVDAHELDEVDGGELRHDVDRVGRAGVSVRAHLVEVLVLVQHRLRPVLSDPLG